MIELAEAPSADLWRALTTLHPATMTEDDLLAAIVACERMKSAVEAYQNDLLVAWDRVGRVDRADLSEVGVDVNGRRERWRTETLALELGVSAFSASHRIDQAIILVETLPRLHAALRCGQVTTQHARLTANAARHLPPEVARAADAAVMVEDGWRTPSQLERAFQAHVLRLDPDGAADRHRAARQDRQVSVRDQPDGMMSAYALLPADDAQSLIKTLDACALSSKATNTPGDDRTLAQRRADALVELVAGSSSWSATFRPADGASPTSLTSTANPGSTTGTASTGTASANTERSGSAAGSTAADENTAATTPTGPCTCSGTTTTAGAGAGAGSGASTVNRDARTHGRRVDVQITVALSTLIGADDAPAMLTGYGWIDATTARRISTDPGAVWRRLLTDPTTGALLDYGRTVYRPPADLRDYVIARDVTCRFPNCDRPAIVCELDHREEFDHTGDHTGAGTTGGSTSPDNLDSLCKRHHRLKHETGWTHHRDPDTGDSIWTDPHRHQYRKDVTLLPAPRPVEAPAPTEPAAPIEPTVPDVLDLGDPPF